MIASLKGIISRVGSNFLELEVGGVGYKVNIKDQRSKIKIGEEIKIYIQMIVSDNDISLYGFRSEEEVEMFGLLRTVSGVGPKTAMQIMGGGEGIEIMKAIGDADVSFFQKIKGIGKKTAQRIIVDLKSKIGGLGELDLSGDGPLLEDELYLSLKQLGFERKEIEKVTKKLPVELITIEERLGWCLRNWE